MSGVVNSTGAVSGIVGKGGLANVITYRASGTSTPTGFSEYTTARGRVICGMPGSGTDGGTVGTALTNAQDKSKSIAHTHTGASHTHTQPTHAHQLPYHPSSGYADPDAFGASSSFTHTEKYSTSSNVGAGSRTLTNTDGGDATGATTPSTSSAMSTNATVVTSDILAYIQLMAIKKD